MSEFKISKFLLWCALVVVLSSCNGGLSVLMSGGTPEQTGNIPFNTGETLTYRMIWNFIPVGYFTVQVADKDPIDGEPTWHFKMRVKTNGFADTFYKVRNSVDAYAHESLRHSLKYTLDQLQGDKVEVTSLTFTEKPPKVNLILDDDDKGWAKLPEPCVDPLTMFYVVRTKDIRTVGENVPIWVSDGEKHIKCDVKVIKQEVIMVNDKEYNTFLIEPDLQELHSVFQRSKGAKIKVWISDDKYKIPLKVASKVVIGRFEARLVEFETGSDDDKLKGSSK